MRLYAEDQTPHLYPHSGLLSNTSQVTTNLSFRGYRESLSTTHTVAVLFSLIDVA